MSLLLRAVIWFGLYVLCALLPVGIALRTDPFDAPRPVTLEFSVALGLIAFAVIMFQFALVSRLQASSRPFGTDALMQFHRQMGLVALLLVVAHPLLLAGAGIGPADWNPFRGRRVTQTGAIAFWAILFVVITSVYRRRLWLSYERWQALHLGMAVLIVGTLLAHVLAVNGYSRVPSMRTLLLAYAGAFLALTLRYRVARPLLLWRYPWEVQSNRDIGGSTRLVRLRPTGHLGFSFEPGQFAWLITGRTPLWSQQHPLSIASSAEVSPDHAVEFSVKALGDWSRHVVPALTPGTRVWVDGPFGAFTTEGKPGQGFVLIAGGIGIAPMRSMLRTLGDRGDRREVLLFYAVHDPTRLLFRDELEQLQGTLNLRIVYVLEEPPESWDRERGYMTAEILQRHLPSQFLRFQYLICGPVPMMNALETTLKGLGIPAAAVHTERFDVV